MSSPWFNLIRRFFGFFSRLNNGQPVSIEARWIMGWHKPITNQDTHLLKLMSMGYTYLEIADLMGRNVNYIKERCGQVIRKAYRAYRD